MNAFRSMQVLGKQIRCALYRQKLDRSHGARRQTGSGPREAQPGKPGRPRENREGGPGEGGGRATRARARERGPSRQDSWLGMTPGLA